MAKRKAIDVELKLALIETFQKGEKISGLAKKHGLAESTVRTIKYTMFEVLVKNHLI